MNTVSVFASIDDVEDVEDREYQAFIAYINDGMITAGFMDAIKDKISKITEFANMVGKSYTEMLSYFKNKDIFSFFTKFNWDIKKIIDAIKEASIFMDKLLSNIAKVIHNNKNIKKMSEVSDQIIKEIDTFLHKHPVLKHIGGVVLAGILLYISVNGVYAGSMADFDMSDVVLAFTGKLTFFDIFSGENGIKMLISLALGLTPLSITYGVWSNIPKATVTLFNLLKKWK